MFKNCEVTRQVWNTTSNYCPNPNNSDMQVIDWLEFIYKNEKVYGRNFKTPLEKIIGITWAIWIHRNFVVFKN